MSENGVMGCIGLIALAVLLSVISITLNAWALSTLWGWFIVSIFELPSLSLMQAMGLSCIVSFIITRSTWSTAKDEDTNWYKAIAFAVIHPVFSVVLGWIVVQFM